MLFKSGTLLAPEDRAEIAASEAAWQPAAREHEETATMQHLCHQGSGGDEAFASPEDDVQDAAAFGEHAPRQTTSEQSGVGACGTSEVLEKGRLGLFRETITRAAVGL